MHVLFHLYDLIFNNRQGHGADTVRKLLAPVNDIAVAARMAGNIARSSVHLESNDGIEEGAYWMAIRKQLEHFYNQE